MDVCKIDFATPPPPPLSQRLIKQINVSVQNQGTVEPPINKKKNLKKKKTARYPKQWGSEKVNQKAPPFDGMTARKVVESAICFLDS